MTPYVKDGLRWELTEDVFSAHDTLKKGTIVNRYPSTRETLPKPVHDFFGFEGVETLYNVIDNDGIEILGVKRSRMKSVN